MVIGGPEFEYRHKILDGSLITFLCGKIALLYEKTEKINEKEAGCCPFKIKKYLGSAFHSVLALMLSCLKSSGSYLGRLTCR